MKSGEKAIKRSYIFKIQLLVFIAAGVIFSMFMFRQNSDIESIRSDKAAVMKKIAYEEDFRGYLSGEGSLTRSTEFFIQQGRDRLGLVLENDIVFIKRK